MIVDFFLEEDDIKYIRKTLGRKKLDFKVIENIIVNAIHCSIFDTVTYRTVIRNCKEEPVMIRVSDYNTDKRIIIRGRESKLVLRSIVEAYLEGSRHEKRKIKELLLDKLDVGIDSE